MVCNGSPSARKVWIEMQLLPRPSLPGRSRLPQGRCGLKCDFAVAIIRWNCRLPQGRCGLKYFYEKERNHYECRLPQGRCGLKCLISVQIKLNIKSPSARKVWIEIQRGRYAGYHYGSPSARKVWIEMRL